MKWGRSFPLKTLYLNKLYVPKQRENKFHVSKNEENWLILHNCTTKTNIIIVVFKNSDEQFMLHQFLRKFLLSFLVKHT